MGTLDGKVAIVTGAGRGLGRAHSMLLASEGARVVVNDLGDEADAVVAEITGSGGEAVANHNSVSDWNGAKELIEQAVDEFGDLHILVNNAGILRDKMSFNMEEDEWDAVIGVHLKGHFCPSRHAGTYWRSQSKAGNDAPRRIINTSSEAGLFGNAGQANYAAAKAGIATLAIVFGRELASYGVTGNAIAPRARTRMTDQFEFFQAPEEDSEFDRFLPENVSPVVAWLATDEASDVNGQVFVVIGGDVWVMQSWSIAGHLHKDGPWSIDELAAKKDELFGDHDRGLPGMAVPSW
jgi:NAD(P)-dependent dehydrogenase (short-subunit alcohol dehydrogenase family)